MQATTTCHRLLCFSFAVLIALPLTLRAEAQGSDSPEQKLTAKIKLGPQEGAAHPTGCGRTATGGGNIYVSQPAPDTLVVRMAGNVAACGNLLVGADAALDFCENLQFAVEFSQPGHAGQLVMESRLVGALAGKGGHTTVGVAHASATVACGPNSIATLPMPPRTVGGGDSIALNSAQGPICAPIYAGCYSLHQVFRIFARQEQGSVCGRAIGEFSPTPLTPTWLGPSYPFQSADKTDYGYEVTLRAVPNAVIR